MGRIKLITLIIISSFFFISINAYSVSTYEKTKKQYRFILSTLRKLDTMVQNFPEDGMKDDFAEIKKKFQFAGEEYFGMNYTSSYEKFKTINTDLGQMLEKFSKKYLKRAKAILDSTSKGSFDILIEFGRDSAYIPYFRKPFDPIRGVKPYNENFTVRDYHLFFHREMISSYIELGYKNYHKANKMFLDEELDYLKKKKAKTIKILNFIGKRYMNIIQICRDAKQYGIEIHKLRNIHQFGDILTKYNLTSRTLSSIFDDRIPEEYKVDAIDNEKLLFPVEKAKFKKNTGK
jgi:hypothetical protein